MIDHDATLGVSPNATGEEIRKAWRRAAQRFHPDATHSPMTSALFLKAKEAYKIPSGGGRGCPPDSPGCMHPFSPHGPEIRACPGLLIPFSGGAR